MSLSTYFIYLEDDSTANVIAVMHMWSQPIPLAMITIRASIHVFSLASYMGMGLRLPGSTIYFWLLAQEIVSEPSKVHVEI